jgi:Fe-S-cluster containining protein
LFSNIFLGFSNNVFSRNYCPDCCDCFKEKSEEESEEEIILKKNNFEYNLNISKYKANIDNNLEEEIKKLDKKVMLLNILKLQKR